MKPFDVYSLYDIEPVRAEGAQVIDREGQRYLDFYGGHAVISVGHTHPHYVGRITDQLQKISFYSNSVQNPMQAELAEKLSELSGLDDYDLFLCSSGAEANENALKMASFQRPGTNTVLALEGSFHGRTSAAVNVTDNDSIQAGINRSIDVVRFAINDGERMAARIYRDDLSAVIIETIQGVGGLSVCPPETLKTVATACRATGTPLIMDEVQSGYGRSGKFFAFQHADIEPDLITMAKGMGNGFPIGGVLIRNATFEAKKGMLGTTYGGNHLACAAGLAVLEIMEQEQLVQGVAAKSDRLRSILETLPGLRRVKGMGLMIGAEFCYPVAELRKQLAHEQKLMTGSSKDPNVLRLLPPLNITDDEIDAFGEKIRAGVQSFVAAHMPVGH